MRLVSGVAFALFVCVTSMTGCGSPPAPAPVPGATATATASVSPAPERDELTVDVAPTAPIGTPDPYAAPVEESREGPHSQPRIDLIKSALVAEQSGDLAGCVTNERAALHLFDEARSRLHAASCENRLGKLVVARSDTSSALAYGQRKRDASVIEVARQRLVELDARLPTVMPSFSGLSVAIDAKTLVSGRKMIADPGAHRIVVRFDSGGQQTSLFTFAEHTHYALEVDAKGLVAVVERP